MGTLITCDFLDYTSSTNLAHSWGLCSVWCFLRNLLKKIISKVIKKLTSLEINKNIVSGNQIDWNILLSELSKVKDIGRILNQEEIPTTNNT